MERQLNKEFPGGGRYKRRYYRFKSGTINSRKGSVECVWKDKNKNLYLELGEVTVEVWKVLRYLGIGLLTGLLNKVLLDGKISEICSKIILAHIL